MQKFVDGLAEWSDKLGQSFFLKVIMGGFMTILPLTMVGSIASLINAITIGGFKAFLTSSGIGAALSAIYDFTVGFIAVYLAFGIAHVAAEILDMKKQSISAGVVSLVCFMVITPYEKGAISVQWLGATGMFSAIICGFAVAGIFKFCLVKKIAIKLPKQVPPMVSNQFTAILPAFFAIVIFGMIKLLFNFTSFGCFHQLIYTILAMPLRSIGGNIFGAYVLLLACNLLWFFGIHGGMIVMNIMMLVFMPLQLENLAAYQAGKPLPNLVSGTFLSVGTGSLVFVLALIIFARSKTASSVSKIAIVPSFFGIDEPSYFGIPMIMNPVFFIPWVVIAPVLTVFGTYILNVTGLLPYASGASIGYNLPFFVTNFVSYGWKGVVWGFVFFIINFIAVIPFIMAYDRQMLKRESQMEVENGAAE
jgi:PTS system cellobiose-specific IIC component